MEKIILIIISFLTGIYIGQLHEEVIKCKELNYNQKGFLTSFMYVPLIILFIEIIILIII